MERPIRQRALPVAAIAVLTWSCAQPPPPEPKAPTTPLVRIGGSETITRSLVPALVASHEKSKGDTRFEVTGGGSGAGIRQMLDGTLDVAASSRKHHAAENDQAKQEGFDLSARGARQIIGMDVVGVVVPENSPIQDLTYDQVIGIFCDRTIDDLTFLGLEAGPIRPVTRDPRSGTRALFEDFFCARGIHSRIETLSSEEISKALESDDTVISFASMTEQSGRVIPLRPVPESDPIAPSAKNIANGRYPLFRDLYLYTPGPPAGAAKPFIDWVLSPAGQDVIDEQRFVPIYHRSKEFDGPRPLRETVHFDSGSSYPNQHSIARVQLLVQELMQKGSKGQHIVLEGFTDNTEADAINLSQKRAEAVRDLLEQQLDGMFFEIIPRGSIRPLAPNTTVFGRNRNRRVQIYLASEEKLGGDVVVPKEEAP